VLKCFKGELKRVQLFLQDLPLIKPNKQNFFFFELSILLGVDKRFYKKHEIKIKSI